MLRAVLHAGEFVRGDGEVWGRPNAALAEPDRRDGSDQLGTSLAGAAGKGCLRPSQHSLRRGELRQPITTQSATRSLRLSSQRSSLSSFAWWKCTASVLSSPIPS